MTKQIADLMAEIHQIEAEHRREHRELSQRIARIDHYHEKEVA